MGSQYDQIVEQMKAKGLRGYAAEHAAKEEVKRIIAARAEETTRRWHEEQKQK